MDTPPAPKDEAKEPARTGFLVRRLVAGESMIVGTDVEITVKKTGAEHAEVAVRAPKDVPIRRVQRNQFRRDP